MPIWNHTLRTGHAELDAGHRELLALLEGAVVAAARRDAAGAHAMLARFHAACLDHFAVEQRAMSSLVGASLPGNAAQAHLDSHGEFLDDLERLQLELGARGLSPLVRLWMSSRLVEWLRFHTRTMDAALAEALTVPHGPAPLGSRPSAGPG